MYKYDYKTEEKKREFSNKICKIKLLNINKNLHTQSVAHFRFALEQTNAVVHWAVLALFHELDF